MLGVLFVDDVHAAFTTDDDIVRATLFDTCSNFHNLSLRFR